MKKAFALLLAACCIFTGISFAFPIVADEAETGDAASTKIEIATAEDFLKIGNDANFPLDGSYLLKNDIAITSEAYVPVGTYAAPFTGSFDGNGKTVTLNVTYGNHGAASYMQNCISLVAVDSTLECYSRMAKDKCINNYVPSDTKKADGATKLTTASTQKEQLVKEVMNKTADIEGMKDRLVAAGVGDLVSLYFDYNKPTGATTLGYQVMPTIWKIRK